MSVIETMDREWIVGPLHGFLKRLVAWMIEIRRRRAEARVRAALEEMNPHFLRDIGLYRDPVGRLNRYELLVASDIPAGPGTASRWR